MLNKEKVIEAIKTVIDPEVGFDIYSLGLIYEILIDGAEVKVIMTLSTRGCPLHELIKQWTKEAVLRVDEVNSCEIEIVWEPSWNITMASDEVKKALGA
ncbi:MAG TPA: DNA methyltransferase [Sulfurospirillum sp. UBA11407]|jgi:metal-sulfur cluster biosynthetic enzyme|nr:MAG TPA: DNA methyltransferase [Sulfurospirillum sp. UBA11407]DAB34326.1 MAG TPA: DNA methyltransferase [Sulfurospirillum sp. UBA12182]